MAEKKPPREAVVQLPIGNVLGPLQARIRACAVVTSKVYIGEHAAQRMWERDISSVEVFEVLRLGSISGSPWIEPESGDQACKVVFRKRGARAIGVVTIVLATDGLFVKTVEWED